jgi:hypothetical protein
VPWRPAELGGDEGRVEDAALQLVESESDHVHHYVADSVEAAKRA